MNSIVHDLPGTLWCGPAVLSAITGLKTSSFEKYNDTGKCAPGVMHTILKLHGYSMWRAKDICKHIRLADLEGLNLCVVDPGKGHWVLVENGMLVDSANRTPTLINDTRFADSEIRECYPITRG